MVNPKLENLHLPYNAPSTVHFKTSKPSTLTVITRSHRKEWRRYQKDNFEHIADQVILIRPKNFREQTAVIDRIQDYTAKNFGLIVIDTLTSLYGAEVAQRSGKAFSVNRELNRQLAILAQSTKTRKIPVIVISQVRSVLDNRNVTVAPVANGF